MNYLEFRKSFIEVGCFATNQVMAQYPDFCANNLSRWVKQGLILKLRQGLYTFPEYRENPDFALYLSNKIYNPSYISLHTALAFYGIIPEAVTQITAVSSMKTATFENDFGQYSYNKLKEDLMFGYELKPFGNRTIRFAYPEKALLDLLYLYPFYNTEEELENLRLDEYALANDIDHKRLDKYTTKFGSKALSKRVEQLKNVYDL